ncbi:MAG TPA: carboxyl-terminal protease [Verrucomicrobia subdivision 3 bacterium]|nr:carboxyl-terminal protease [Limisphaerales bacterium]
MKRRFIFGLVVVALLLNLAVGAKIYLSAAQASNNDDSAQQNLEVFTDAMQKIRSEYVDGKDLKYQQLVYAALKGMVGKLDPHSEFLDETSFQQLQDDTEGQFGGLGLVVAMKDGYVIVVAPMEDAPGFRAGILTGDRIVRVEGKSVEKLPLTEVVKQLRGEPGSAVTLAVERPSTGVTKNYTLLRAVIQMIMVKDINGKKEFPLDENKIGYLRITQFAEKTADELESALGKLKRQGMKGLIIDLRWNPGGLLEQAVAVCQKFLPRGQLVVSTEGRRLLEKYFAKGDGDELKNVPIVVLVNLNSASAAEIVTGCLQDLHRAVILGEKTFGKGSVQTIFPLEDGSALKLTVAKYYTPSHKVIHQHGITPDILVPVSDEEEAAVLLKRAPGAVESLPEKDRVRVSEIRDEQADRAEDLLKGLIIYDTLNGVPKPEKVAAK